jgi:hydroxyacylglutathione hydrolase
MMRPRAEMKYEVVVVGALETNCYLAYCPETLQCAIVDPGAQAERIFSAVAGRKLTPVVILNTHGHVDHTGSNREMKTRYDVPLRIHAADAALLAGTHSVELSLLLGAEPSPPPDSYLEDGERVTIGRQSLSVLHTPGHTPGSVCLLAARFLLAGDTLFCGGVGRTDLQGGSARDLEKSIREKILTLKDELLVLPGHGPFTTVGRERSSNPFLS